MVLSTGEEEEEEEEEIVFDAGSTAAAARESEGADGCWGLRPDRNLTGFGDERLVMFVVFVGEASELWLRTRLSFRS